MRAIRAAIFVAVLVVPSVGLAQTTSVSPGEDLAAVFAALAPGDELVFDAGTYNLGSGLDVVVAGSVDDPITLRGDGDVVLKAPDGEFTFKVSGSSFTIVGMEIQGPGSALIVEATDVQLRNLVITDATIGIQCNACAGVSVTDTEFFGLSSTAVLSNGFVSGFVGSNWIHDIEGNAIALVGQTANANVSDNIIESIGGDGIRVEFPVELADQPPNQVVGNRISAPPGEGIATSGSVIVASNIVTDAGIHGIHSTVGEAITNLDARIIHNTVVGTSCFRASDWGLSSATNVLANNALYCEDGTAIQFDNGGGVGTTVSLNIYLGSADLPGDSVVGGSLSADFADASRGDYYPSSSSPLIDFGAAEWLFTPDFNGSLRTDPVDAGAYEYGPANNPELPPGGAFKGEEPPPARADAGSGADGGSGTSGGAFGGGTTNFPDRNGCGCDTGGQSAAFALPLLMFVAGCRRRRRRRAA